MLMVLTGYLYVTIPKGFFPQQDTGFIFGTAETRQDSSFAKMAAIMEQIADIARADPAASGVVAFAGASSSNPSENTGRMFIQLKPHDQRDLTSDQIIQRLRPKVAAVQGAKFFMQSGQDISIGGRHCSHHKQYTNSHTNIDESNHYAPDIQKTIEKISERYG